MATRNLTAEDDLLKRLRSHALGHELTYGHTGICGEAADEIERLRKALESIATETDAICDFDGFFLRAKARASLNGEEA